MPDGVSRHSAGSDFFFSTLEATGPLLTKAAEKRSSTSFMGLGGFFFAVFVPRGLYGFPLIGHVMAGGVFAVCLTLVVIFKSRNFTSIPEPLELSLTLFDPKRLGLTAARTRHAAFWLFVLAGFLLTLSSLLPMMPLLRTPGQMLMFELHRYSALASVLAAMVYVGMELYERSRAS